MKITAGTLCRGMKMIIRRAQSQIEKGKRNLDSGLSLKSYSSATEVPKFYHFSCAKDQMMCQKSKICISNAWVCDGDLGRS